ncbi:MAG: hypothetical protein ACRC4N_17240 [Gammaproteobacteria bacterium]
MDALVLVTNTNMAAAAELGELYAVPDVYFPLWVIIDTDALSVKQ